MGVLEIILALSVIIVLLFVVNSMANERGRSREGWFFLSILTTPIFTMLLLSIMGDSDDRRREKIIKEEELRRSVSDRSERAAHSGSSTKSGDGRPLNERYKIEGETINDRYKRS